MSDNSANDVGGNVCLLGTVKYLYLYVCMILLDEDNNNPLPFARLICGHI